MLHTVSKAITEKSEIKKSRKLKSSGLFMALLPLSACSGAGGGGGGGSTTPAPAPVLPAEFLEDPTAVFIARDDRDTDLDQGSATDDLTVTGKGGDDTIQTGSGADSIDGAGGADIIRSGEGIDTINAGSGNDAIVLVGTTGAAEYQNSDITNAGSGYDLSDVITLADLNGRSVSEVEAGEVIDGGSGTNILFIYGVVDLTGVTLSNVTILEVHSNVTLTPEQLAQFTTVDGDGNSVINIQIPEGSPDTYTLDLSALNIVDIATINIDGNITVIIDDASDLTGIASITSGAGDSLTLQVVGNTTIDLATIGQTFDQLDTLELGSDATVNVDAPADITNLGLTTIDGTGTITTDGSSEVDATLDGISIDPAVNGIPYAVTDTANTTENTAVTVDVIANDTDIDNDVLSISAYNLIGDKGSVSIVDGKLKFDPGTDYDYLDDGESEDVTIYYDVSDGQDTDETTLVITINGENDAPTTVDDTGTTTENVAKSFDVLSDDSDIDGEDITLTGVSVGAGQGSVSIVDGKVQFNPGTDFDDLATGATENVEVTYSVSDGDLTTDGTLTITVTGTNDAPVANDDTDDAGENETITIDVLLNDDDEENDVLSITAASVADGKGSVSIVDGKIEYNPGTDFDALAAGITEDVVISYTVSDGDKTDAGSATVTITGVNDAPVTEDDIDEILNTETSTVDVLANDGDAENDTLSLTAVSGTVGKGSVSIVDGKVFFDPGTDFDALVPAETEDVQITYTVSDGDKTSDGTLTITIVGPNEAPVTVNDTAVAGENETILVDVLADDTDGDGHTLTISNVMVAEGKGTVSVVDGKVQFVPGYDFDYLTDGESVDVVITYTAYDGIDETDGTLTITVNGVSDDPIALSDDAEVSEGRYVYIDVLNNDYDPEGGEVEILSATADVGTVTIENGYLKYTAPANAGDLGYGDTDLATISYTITGLNGSAASTVDVTLNGVNDDPVAINDSYSMYEGFTGTFNVLFDDTDANGDDLFIYNVENPSGLGTITIENNVLKFDTAGDFNYLGFGDDETITIYYDVIDGYGGTDRGSISVTIEGFGSRDEDEPVNTNFYLYTTNVYFPESAMAGTFKNVYLNQDTFIYGWEYNDTITVGSGDDYVDGWDGADTMDGGKGLDVLGYSESDAGVTVNLLTGDASGGYASGDSFVNFEGIAGSDYADSLTGDNESNGLYGNGGADTLNGLDGDDFIDGGTGGDFLDGGAGFDYLSYIFSTTGVTVNLETGSASGGDATGDTISNFEGIYGSDNNDVLTGDGNDNFFDGFGGVDVLSGGGGNDTFYLYQIDNSEEDEVDGGTGYDGLFFYGSGGSSAYKIDISTLDATNIEFISLYASIEAEMLVFSAQDVIDITDGYNELAIIGGSNDSLQSNSVWTYEGDGFDGIFTYSAYTSGEATILVYRTIDEDNIILAQSGSFSEIRRGVWEAADDSSSSLYLSDSTLYLTITGKGGDDVIYSGSGRDKIEGGAGADILNGGSDEDTLYYESSDAGVTVSLDSGTGTGGHAEGDVISNFERLYGSNYDDHLTGDNLNNYIYGGEGNDTIYGLGGADYIFGGDGINILYGGDGNDYFSPSGEKDTIYGGEGDDIIYIRDGINIVDGGAGLDEINFLWVDSGIEIDLSTGSMSGTSTIGDFYTNIEKIESTQYDDVLIGDENDNIFDGSRGNDTLIGGIGNDEIEGNYGNDTIHGDEGEDILSGGYGEDIITGGIGNDVINGDGGDDVIYGQEGDDIIYGGNDNDIINGQSGNDTIYGGNGSDIISGGEGIDELDGGGGDDFLEFSGILDTYDGYLGTDTLFTNVALDINFSDVTIDDIEVIDLDNLTSDSIEFSLINAKYMTNNDEDILTIHGTSDDSVTSSGEGWILGDDQVIDSETYNTYTADGVTLLVDADIIQDIS